MEKHIRAYNGLAFLALMLLGLIGLTAGIIYGAANKIEPLAGACVIGMIIWIFIMSGFFIVEPNGSKVLLLFGNYKGTVRDAGLHWANPFYSKRSISLRARTLNGERLKVNDAAGNPVEIAAIVVWRVVDTYKASFDVDNYEQFVALQSETAVRHSASSYPYDADEATISLRRNTEEVGDHLAEELKTRLALAGVEIIEARLAHLAYASEIAGVMLRRQQAAAVIAARQMIVDGAVGMVEMALEHMDRTKLIELDSERKAQMVSNLMVVLCSEHGASPVVNAGSMY